ncbi:MAG: hypothetical protein BGN96_04885 [Bacteroidales bacterium 45-6]|uniref:DUF3853 family protein n=1 Tax=uncultured Dysgonomonas sp. TaxID=206096 RepID=UPI0009669871|nr:DUF3853 family protein [uncultured Dysgonomonas sp.]OJU35473.1 MAG: hypothetical protein BGN96_04885 [Bacteroidales bacterium 45-6]
MDKQKPLFQATLEDFENSMKAILISMAEEKDAFGKMPKSEKRHVYGIAGIAELFGCSIPTAQRIKSSGKIDDAISQCGKIIVVDAELALELTKNEKFKFRKNNRGRK